MGLNQVSIDKHDLNETSFSDLILSQFTKVKEKQKINLFKLLNNQKHKNRQKKL